MIEVDEIDESYLWTGKGSADPELAQLEQDLSELGWTPRALPGFEPWLFPVWLVVHRELHTSGRVRVVFDLLAEALAEL